MQTTIKHRNNISSIDWKLVILYLILILIGWFNIYASVHSSEPSSIFDISERCGKQFIWIITSLLIASSILFIIPAQLWEGISIPMYILSCIALVAVIFFGVEVKGSRSWFQIAQIKIQPAEISKIASSLAISYILSKDWFKISKVKDFITISLIILVPMFIIIAEKETGSALVYTGFALVLYREGLSGWFLVAIGTAILLFVLTLTANSYIAILSLIIIIAFINILQNNKILRNTTILLLFSITMFFVPQILNKAAEYMEFFKSIKALYVLFGICLSTTPYFLVKAFRKGNISYYLSTICLIAGITLSLSTEFIFNSVLKEHQRKRIELILGMTEDPSGVGYNVNQSMIAIGSGGLSGKGFLNGTQTTYGFVPEQSTDFIFCTIGEEWGFIGSSFVIILYILLMLRILYDAEKSRGSFTRIYGYCVASCILIHLFINIGMTMGIMPVIGIPLPLISYGGSSIVSFTVLIFIFIALDHQEKKYFN